MIEATDPEGQADLTKLTNALLALFRGDEDALWEAVKAAAEEVGVADLLPQESNTSPTTQG